MEPKFLERRASFNQVPELYASARPGYPDELIDTVSALVGPGARLLEVGCGPGQATEAFARRGHRILALELGPDLATYAQQRFAANPLVEVRSQDFHSFKPETGAFDGVFAGSSWHWLMPEVAFPIAAEALKPGGILALFWNRHVKNPQQEEFETELQAIYEQEAPELTRRGEGPPHFKDLTDERSEQIRATGFFEGVEMMRFRWELELTSEEFVRTMATYSDHIILADDVKERLFARVRELIDRQPGGRVRKAHVSVMYVASKITG